MGSKVSESITTCIVYATTLGLPKTKSGMHSSSPMTVPFGEPIRKPVGKPPKVKLGKAQPPVVTGPEHHPLSRGPELGHPPQPTPKLLVDWV